MASPRKTKVINFFPHLALYTNPKTGILAKVPSSLIPYLQLMRVDRPAGFYAFYFPYLIGLMYAGCIIPNTPSPQSLLGHALTLIPFNILMRGAACTWNDNVDQHFDRQVERCRHRPIARGAVSTAQANVFTLVQLALGYCNATAFPKACLPHILFVVMLFGVYALMKRVTYYPQVVLGFPFAWAIFISVVSLGVDPFHGKHVAATLALFSANVLWTVIYDTIYAHQDIADDRKAGVKGMALRFQNNTKILATVLSFGQVGLLIFCGVCSDFSSIYFIGTVGGVSISLSYYIYDVDLKRPESCGAWFHDQFFFVGAGFLAGLTGEYATKLLV